METNTCPHTKLTKRYNWLFCDDCKTHIAGDPTRCTSCNGHGFNNRMTSIYSKERGKKYRCGNCKGTGTVAPVQCTSCDSDAVMHVSNVMGVDGVWRGDNSGVSRPLCQCCYNTEAQ